MSPILIYCHIDHLSSSPSLSVTNLAKERSLLMHEISNSYLGIKIEDHMVRLFSFEKNHELSSSVQSLTSKYDLSCRFCRSFL